MYYSINLTDQKQGLYFNTISDSDTFSKQLQLVQLTMLLVCVKKHNDSVSKQMLVNQQYTVLIKWTNRAYTMGDFAATHRELK